MIEQHPTWQWLANLVIGALGALSLLFVSIMAKIRSRKEQDDKLDITRRYEKSDSKFKELFQRMSNAEMNVAVLNAHIEQSGRERQEIKNILADIDKRIDNLFKAVLRNNRANDIDRD